ncbi:MAG TPA: 6,7-dimethyl-8-ribityllumazine synthase [Dehalococcoidia bacterium]|nr:6,7-dimethyl-8-ribityllumazine synthase [Dehalococcoidia bacterium]
MVRSFEGMLTGEGLRFAIVASRFNELITHRLVDGAQDALRRHGVADDAVDIAWCPGSFEIPLVARKLAETGGYDAIICLGAVIRGGTPHSDYVAAEVNKGIAKLSLDMGLPFVQGIITADTLEQAIQRAGAKEGNRGWSAALSAIEMANLMKSIR